MAFGGIGNFVGNVADKLVESTVGELIGDKAADIAGDIVGGIVGTAIEGAGEAAAFIADAVDAATPDAGDIAEEFFDSIGAPEWLGDVASGVVNVATGNMAAATSDAVDFMSSEESNESKESKESKGPQEQTYETLPADYDKNLGGQAQACGSSDGAARGSYTFERSSGGRVNESASDATSPPGNDAGAAKAGDAKAGDMKAASASAPAEKTSGEVTEGMTWVKNASEGDLRAALQSGDIPPSVLSDSNAMLMLQMKLQEMSRTQQLYSNLSSAFHEMEMGLVRNMRA